MALYFGLWSYNSNPQKNKFLGDYIFSRILRQVIGKPLEELLSIKVISAILERERKFWEKILIAIVMQKMANSRLVNCKQTRFDRMSLLTIASAISGQITIPVVR